MAEEYDVFGYPKSDKSPKCGFCYPREQGTHGEIKREWADEWKQYISVCRKHSWNELQNLSDKELAKRTWHTWNSFSGRHEEKTESDADWLCRIMRLAIDRIAYAKTD